MVERDWSVVNLAVSGLRPNDFKSWPSAARQSVHDVHKRVHYVHYFGRVTSRFDYLFHDVCCHIVIYCTLRGLMSFTIFVHCSSLLIIAYLLVPRRHSGPFVHDVRCCYTTFRCFSPRVHSVRFWLVSLTVCQFR